MNKQLLFAVILGVAFFVAPIVNADQEQVESQESGAQGGWLSSVKDFFTPEAKPDTRDLGVTRDATSVFDAVPDEEFPVESVKEDESGKESAQ